MRPRSLVVEAMRRGEAVVHLGFREREGVAKV
jgi:hypothetical protein